MSEDSQVLLLPKPQRFRIFGSQEESSDSRHFLHFRSSCDPITSSGPRRGRRDLRLYGSLRSDAELVPLQMKLDAKGNDGVRSS